MSAALNDESSLLQEVFAKIPSAVVVIDEHGVIKKANLSALHLLGEPTLEGRRWVEVITQVFRPRNDDGHEISTRDGRRLQVATLPLSLGQLVQMTDLTETRLLQEKMAHMERLSSLGRMAASLAHQIRTPLSAAMLYASNLGNAGLTPAAHQRFQEKLVNRLQALEAQVSDILMFARSNDLHVSEINAADLLMQTANNVTAVLTRNQAHLLTVVEPDAHFPILGSASSLIGALSNLIVNGIEAGAKNVVLKLEQVGDRVIFSVANDGPPISEKLKTKIFEPFFTSKSSGTGLGLAVVSAVTKVHQGILTLDTWAAPFFTVFSISLPLYVANASVPAPEVTKAVNAVVSAQDSQLLSTAVQSDAELLVDAKDAAPSDALAASAIPAKPYAFNKSEVSDTTVTSTQAETNAVVSEMEVDNVSMAFETTSLAKTAQAETEFEAFASPAEAAATTGSDVDGVAESSLYSESSDTSLAHKSEAEIAKEVDSEDESHKTLGNAEEAKQTKENAKTEVEATVECVVSTDSTFVADKAEAMGHSAKNEQIMSMVSDVSEASAQQGSYELLSEEEDDLGDYGEGTEELEHLSNAVAQDHQYQENKSDGLSETSITYDAVNTANNVMVMTAVSTQGEQNSQDRVAAELELKAEKERELKSFPVNSADVHSDGDADYDAEDGDGIENIDAIESCIDDHEEKYADEEESAFASDPDVTDRDDGFGTDGFSNEGFGLDSEELAREKEMANKATTIALSMYTQQVRVNAYVPAPQMALAALSESGDREDVPLEQTELEEQLDTAELRSLADSEDDDIESIEQLELAAKIRQAAFGEYGDNDESMPQAVGKDLPLAVPSIKNQLLRVKPKKGSVAAGSPALTVAMSKASTLTKRAAATKSRAAHRHKVNAAANASANNAKTEVNNRINVRVLGQDRKGFKQVEIDLPRNMERHDNN